MSIFDKSKIAGVLCHETGHSKEETLEELDKHPEKLPSISVISYDVPSIKKYIFSTNDFKGMLGASSALKAFDEFVPEIAKSLGACVISASAGSGLFLCPKSTTTELESSLKESFVSAVPGASLVVSSVELLPVELINGLSGRALESASSVCAKITDVSEQASFSAVFEFLASQLAEKKQQEAFKKRIMTPELKRCSFCGDNPASKRLDAFEDLSFVCETCFSKREKARSIINELHMVDTIDEIDVTTEEEKKSRWYGVIYFDGNNLGDIYSHISNDKQYVDTSIRIERAVYEAEREAIEEFSLKGRYCKPISGGDDLMLMVPVALLFEVYSFLSSRIKDRLSEMNICFSAAVAAFPKKLPIKFVFELSNGLLASAKASAYAANADNPPDSVAFRFFDNNSMNPTERIVMTEPNSVETVCEELGEGMSTDTFNRTLALLNNLKPGDIEPFLHRTLSCLREDPIVAKLNIGYFFSRRDSRAIRDYFGNAEEFIRRFAILPETTSEGFYKSSIITLLDMLRVHKAKAKAGETEVRL